MPGRCEPHGAVGGAASGAGGKGRVLDANGFSHGSSGRGAPGIRSANAAVRKLPSGRTSTSQAPDASAPQGSAESRRRALKYTLPLPAAASPPATKMFESTPAASGAMRIPNPVAGSMR
jgi:hypothetical protein